MESEPELRVRAAFDPFGNFSPVLGEIFAGRNKTESLNTCSLFERQTCGGSAPVPCLGGYCRVNENCVSSRAGCCQISCQTCGGNYCYEAGALCCNGGATACKSMPCCCGVGCCQPGTSHSGCLGYYTSSEKCCPGACKLPLSHQPTPF